MLLAAGRGERMRPLTDTLPKPLLEVQGRSLIERHLDRLSAAGVSSVVVNLGWLGARLVDRIGSGARYGLKVVYSDERDGVLDTAGGIQRALPLLGTEPFMVINADVFTEMPLPCPLPRADESVHLVLVPRPAFRPLGDFDLIDGKAANGEKPAYTYAGVSSYRPEFFAGLLPGKSPLPPLWRHAADRGLVGASLYAGAWQDVGTPERLAALNGA
ncbi:MAG: nucleotidyltransferase family protein [Pseudomonadota bacterium]